VVQGFEEHHEQLCHFAVRLLPVAGHHGACDQQEEPAEERPQRREDQIPFHAQLPLLYAASIAVLHVGRITPKAASGPEGRQIDIERVSAGWMTASRAEPTRPT